MENNREQQQSELKVEAQKRDWHAHASFNLKMGFLIFGIIMFIAWVAWMKFFAI